MMVTSRDGISGLKCDHESRQGGAVLAVPRGLGGQRLVCLAAARAVLCRSLRQGPGRGTLSCSVPSQCRGLVSVLCRLLPKHGPASPETLQVEYSVPVWGDALPQSQNEPFHPYKAMPRVKAERPWQTLLRCRRPAW